MLQPLNASGAVWFEEGGDEAEQGGFGQVEVGDEVIDSAKGDWRVEEKVGLGAEMPFAGKAGVGIAPAAAHGILDGSYAGGADGDARPGATGLQCAVGFGGDFIPLVVDGVVFDLPGLHGVEGADADLQGEVVEAGAAGFELADQIRGEVQAGGGGGHRELLFVVGVNRLVAFFVLTVAGVFGGALNIRREGHYADAPGEFDY